MIKVLNLSSWIVTNEILERRIMCLDTSYEEKKIVWRQARMEETSNARLGDVELVDRDNPWKARRNHESDDPLYEFIPFKYQRSWP